MEKEIYIVRHGETAFNRAGIVQGSGIDSELNETGLRQAQLFYEYYKKEGFELLYASDLRRSQQTLEPFVQEGIPLLVTPSIREISWGRYEGQPYTPAMKKRYTEMLRAWASGDLDHRMEEGESAAELALRVRSFLDELLTRPERRILVCSHGRTIRCMACVMQQLPMASMEKFEHNNTGLFRARYRDGGFLLQLTNDTTHLGTTARKIVA